MFLTYTYSTLKLTYSYILFLQYSEWITRQVKLMYQSPVVCMSACVCNEPALSSVYPYSSCCVGLNGLFRILNHVCACKFCYVVFVGILIYTRHTCILLPGSFYIIFIWIPDQHNSAAISFCKYYFIRMTPPPPQKKYCRLFSIFS